MFQTVGSLLSPAGRRAKLIILIYHRVLPAADGILHDEIEARSFERQMQLLAAEFNVLPLGEAAERLKTQSLPPRAVCITFDDGYANNEQVAFPILKRHGLRATFFISTGFAAGAVMFNDAIIESVRSARAGEHDLTSLGLGRFDLSDNSRRRAAVDTLIRALKYRTLPERRTLLEQISGAFGSTPASDLMMNSEQIRKLHVEGMEIGAHTVNHPILMSISDTEARAEILDSKHALEDITRSPVTVFAYPNGKPGTDYGPQHVRFVKEAGFAAAVSTSQGVAHRASELFELPRFGPWERRPQRLAIRMLLACARASRGN